MPGPVCRPPDASIVAKERVTAAGRPQRPRLHAAAGGARTAAPGRCPRVSRSTRRASMFLMLRIEGPEGPGQRQMIFSLPRAPPSAAAGLPIYKFVCFKSSHRSNILAVEDRYCLPSCVAAVDVGACRRQPSPTTGPGPARGYSAGSPDRALVEPRGKHTRVDAAVPHHSPIALGAMTTQSPAQPSRGTPWLMRSKPATLGADSSIPHRGHDGRSPYYCTWSRSRPSRGRNATTMPAK
jgi:hypothetical protein